MTWTKLSDGFNHDPILLALPRGIRLLHVEAMVWSNSHGTDGAVPLHVLSRITDEPDPPAAAEQLVAAGLWALTDKGWQLATFLKDQLPAAEVEKARFQAALRTKRWKLHREGDHSLCRKSYCKDASPDASVDASPDASVDASPDGSSNASSDASADALSIRPSRPPAREVGKGRAMEKKRPAARSDTGGDSRPADGLVDVVDCSDYRAHQMRHRAQGERFICELCSGVGDPAPALPTVLTPRPRPSARPRAASA